MELTLSWLHVPAEGRKKEIRSSAKTLQSLQSHWHLCQGWQGGEGAPRRAGQCLSPPRAPPGSVISMPKLGGEDELWKAPTEEERERASPHTGYNTWSLECLQKIKWHFLELREAWGLHLPWNIFGFFRGFGRAGWQGSVYPCSSICLECNWVKQISNLFFHAAALKLKFCFEGTHSEGKFFCGWCADLYKGRIKVLLFFSQVHKNVHREFSMENSSKWTLGSKILNSMGQHM